MRINSNISTQQLCKQLRTNNATPEQALVDVIQLQDSDATLNAEQKANQRLLSPRIAAFFNHFL